MAKKEGKPLLNEGTIRRFMALAEIGGLSDNFVGDLYEQDEEEELEPELGAEEPPLEEPGLEAGAEEPPLEEPGLEAGAEMEPAPPEGGMGEEELNQFVEDVIAGVAQAAADLGVDVDVEGAAGSAAAGGEDELGGLGDEAELGGLPGEEPLGEPPPEGELGEPGLEGGEELGGLEGEEEEEELPPGNRMYENEKLADVVDDEAIVNEVAKRVAARLIRASRAAKK